MQRARAQIRMRGVTLVTESRLVVIVVIAFESLPSDAQQGRAPTPDRSGCTEADQPPGRSKLHVHMQHACACACHASLGTIMWLPDESSLLPAPLLHDATALPELASCRRPLLQENATTLAAENPLLIEFLLLHLDVTQSNTKLAFRLQFNLTVMLQPVTGYCAGGLIGAYIQRRQGVSLFLRDRQKKSLCS